MARSSALVSIAFLMACGGGGPEPKPDVPLTEVSCALGALDENDQYQLFSEQSNAELILGFQGFLFLSTHISSAEMSECTAITSIEMVGVEPSGGSQPELPFAGELSGELLFFLPTSNIASYVDQPATLAVRLEDDIHFCVATAEVTLVDLDACIHADDGDICPGDTGQ